MRTRGFRRSKKAFRDDVTTRVSLPFAWAGNIDVALAGIEEAIGELRRASRRGRRRKGGAGSPGDLLGGS